MDAITVKMQIAENAKQKIESIIIANNINRKAMEKIQESYEHLKKIIVEANEITGVNNG